MKPNFVKLTTDPGVYRFYDASKKLIYIGKAKNLRNRIRSYWAKDTELSPAKQQMVNEIADVDVIAVNNEQEALLLEAGLIKRYQPKYNIVLRDDKNWTYIVITAEAFPRIVTTHGTKQLKGEYFGPFTSGATARYIVRLLHRIIPLRTCKRDLSKLPNGLVCMQYHLGRCLGPCEKKISSTEYDALIDRARSLLRGEGKIVLNELHNEMKAASQTKKFEQAALIRDKIVSWKKISEPQHVVYPHERSVDSVGIAYIDSIAYITVLQIRRGQISEKLTYSLSNSLHLSFDELLEQFVAQFYSTPLMRPVEAILPTAISSAVAAALTPIRFTAPQRGAKKKLLQLAEKNAWLYYQRQKQITVIPQTLYDLRDAFQLASVPMRIEAYDISNISGDYAVGAMVVAMNGKLMPSEYRKFKIKTVKGPNDVMMMREMIMRRQTHDEWPEPQLIILDGGKPQLNTVYPIIKPEWKDRIVALAKREEEVFVPGRSKSIRLPLSDPRSLLIRKIRDAVHKQAISYYRKTHKKASITK